MGKLNEETPKGWTAQKVRPQATKRVSALSTPVTTETETEQPSTPAKKATKRKKK